MLEIIRRVRTLRKNYRVCFWRTSGGAEVDCVIDLGTKVIPIEIKSSKTTTASDVRGLKNFLAEYKKQASVGYVITMGERKEKIADNIIALPWSHL
jgi:predicted AAA+ superfamily ATPase